MQPIESAERSRFRLVVAADRQTGLLTGSEAERLLDLCESHHSDAYLWEQRAAIVWPRRWDLLLRYAILLGFVGFLFMLPRLLRHVME